MFLVTAFFFSFFIISLFHFVASLTIQSLFKNWILDIIKATSLNVRILYSLNSFEPCLDGRLFGHLRIVFKLFYNPLRVAFLWVYTLLRHTSALGVDWVFSKCLIRNKSE